jgi:WD40 repeat protein
VSGSLHSAAGGRHHAPLRPTVQGMCLVPQYEELYCAEHPCKVTVRSAVPSTKFHAKTVVEIPLPHPDSFFRSLHYVPGPTGADGWVWCSASSGELAAIHVQSKKYVMIADFSALQDAGPIAALGDLWTLQKTVVETAPDGLQPHRHRVVVSISRSGVVGLWDVSTRTRFTTLPCILPANINSSPLFSVAHPAVKTPLHAHTHNNTSQLRVKCSSSWASAGIVFVGVGVTSSSGPNLGGLVYVVDGRRLSHTTSSVLHLPTTTGGVSEEFPELPLDGAVLSMAFEPSPHARDQGSLWISTSTGAVGRIDCGAASGAGAEGSVVAYNARWRRGVHDGFSHKLCLSGAQHAVSCGSDGRVAILDVDTLNVIQKVTLDMGTMVQELCCLGEMAASSGSVSMLLAISDRTFRCMSLKRSGPWTSASRGGSPARGSPRRHLSPSSPMRSSPLGRRHSQVVLPAGGSQTSLTTPLTTQQLLYHCMSLLQGLKSIEAAEVEARSDFLEAELVARDMLYHYWDYLCCGGRTHQLPSRLWFVQLQEADTRQYWQQEAYLELRSTLRQCNQLWRQASARREVIWNLCWDEEEERHERELVLLSESKERLALQDNLQHLGRLAAATTQRRVDAMAHDATLERLEAALVRLTELEPQAARIAPLQGDLQRMALSLASVTEACHELEDLRVDLDVELRKARSDLQHREVTARLDGHRMLLDAEDVQRYKIREEAASQLAELLSTARHEEGRMLAAAQHLLQEDRTHITALQQHRSTLESVSIHLQRDLRDVELSRDGQRAAHRRLEEQVLSLGEQLAEMTRRLTVSEEHRAVTELELLRVKSSADQHRARLEQSSSLAEDTFKTVLAQRERMQTLRHSLDAIQERLEVFVRLGEQTFDAGITEHRVHKARSALQEAQEDLIAIRRAESHRWSSLESDMANTLSDWMRHTTAAEREQSSSRLSISASRPRPTADDSSSDPAAPFGGETALRTQEHLHHAFHQILSAAELIGPQWMEEVLIIEKSQFFGALRKALSVLAAARGVDA